MNAEDASVSRETEAASKAAERWSAAFPLLERYHGWLVGAGVERGLVGPREVERMWDRHINNSAVLSEAVSENSTVIDVGSGAGLPGIPLAIVRPDLTVTLLEPLQRRVDFLQEVVDDLSLNQRVSVVRGRAEDVKDLQASVVTSRAVAALPKLLGWCWPLVAPGGEIIALKGAQAASEVTSAANYLRKKQLQASIQTVGAGLVEPLTTLVRIRKTN
jgi:16S rRNA (guanine527-N7)-methyltransferase